MRKIRKFKVYFYGAAEGVRGQSRGGPQTTLSETASGSAFNALRFTTAVPSNLTFKSHEFDSAKPMCFL